MKNYLVLIMLVLPVLAFAQDDYTFRFLPIVHQSQWSCAANQPDAKVSVGLPVISGMSFQLYNSGFTYNSLFQRVNDNTVAIHPGAFIDKLKKNNSLDLSATVPFLSFNIAKPDYSIGFSIVDKADLRFSYPKDLFKFFWYGNGAYIGKTVDIGNFALRASWYREYALHGTKTIDKWTFGASPKLLFGKADINTRETSLKLTTGPDFYEITADAKMNVQTSGIPDSTERATNSVPGTSQYIFNTKNVGLGIDLGAKYQYSDKLTLAGGINNLGYINWKSHVHNYTAGPASYYFDGIHVDNFFINDTNVISTSQFVDSVKRTIKFAKNNNSYKSATPYDFYLAGNYRFNERHALGLQFDAQRFNKYFVIGSTLCYQYSPTNRFTGVLSYTAKSNAYTNLGLGLVATVSPVQLYYATDNWLGILKPTGTKNVNMHFGLNIAIGHKNSANTGHHNSRI